MPLALNGDVGASLVQDNSITAAKLATAAVGSAAPQKMLLTATQNTTSGTSIDFTGIPSWAKKITVVLNGVSTNGTSPLLAQLGAGSVTTSGYASGAVSARATTSSAPVATATNGILSYNDFVAATDLISGVVHLLLVSGSSWVGAAITGNSAGSRATTGTGTITLPSTLDRIRLTTVNGTDTFDAGSVSLLIEGY